MLPIRCTFTCFILAITCLAVRDTLPPAGRFTQPEPFTIITTDLVRIQVQADDGQSGVKEVSFYAVLADETAIAGDTLLIGRDSEPPFEIVWKCHDVPDQRFGKNSFFARITDRAGNIAVIQPGYHLFYLDRNPEPKDIVFNSKFTDKPISIDGKMDEWPDNEDAVMLKGSDNSVKAYSRWDNTFLYFAMDVKDRYLYYSKDTSKVLAFPEFSSVGYFELWKSDFLELSFDLDHDHNIIPNLNDMEYLVSVHGIAQGNRRDIRKKTVELWGRDALCSVRTYGTLNDFSDVDTGFVVEVAIPWHELGLKPHAGMTIGFDLFNGDIDEPGGRAIRTTWSGVKRINNDNPSEWGNLVLAGKTERSTFFIVIAACVILLLCMIVAVLWLKLKQQQNILEEMPVSQKEHHVQQARDYILTDFGDAQLNLQKVAEALSINKVYLSTIFKEISKENFIVFLNKTRVEEAKQLLAKTDKSITAVGFEVGYGTLEHFIRIFKSQTGQTPLEFRKKLRNIS